MSQSEPPSTQPDTPPPDTPPPDRRRPEVSVITPTFNEVANIEPLLDALHLALADLDFEIIVADDDSPDGTWRVAEEYALTHPRVRVLRRFHDPGLSEAVLAGMEIATGTTLAVIDADLQHDERVLPQMVAPVLHGDVDLCVGSRATSDGGYGDWSPVRRFISWVATLIARLFLRVPVRDPMSGFFVVSRQVFVDTAPVINPQGFKILLEFLGRRNDLRVSEVGYRFRNRTAGETKMSRSVIRSYLLAVFELRFGRWIKPQVVLYALVGTLGVVVNSLAYLLGRGLGLGTWSTGWSGSLATLDTALLFAAQVAVLSNFLVNNWFTFWERRWRGPSLLVGFALFWMVALVGMVVQVSVFKMLQSTGWGLGALGETWSRAVHNLVGTIIAFVGNYLLNVNITWGWRRD